MKWMDVVNWQANLLRNHLVMGASRVYTVATAWLSQSSRLEPPFSPFSAELVPDSSISNIGHMSMIS